MNIGTLTIEMAANVARIQSDMDATRRIVGGAMKDVEQYVGYAKTAFIALGGVTSIAAFTGIVNGAIEAKSKLYDMSIQTGISVEALSGLGKVAKFSNTDLSDVATASNKLAKSLFTSGEESKGAAQALKALGLNFNEFKQLAPEQQLVQVANALETFRDGTEKSAAAQLLFGKAGAQLLPFLKELAERGFAVGKQTTESALQAKKYEDNLITLKAAADAWKRELAEALLPTLIAITDKFIDARKGADQFNLAGEAIKVVMQTVSVLGANVAFVFGGIGRELGALAAQAVAIASGNLEGAHQIRLAVNEDGRRARADLDETEQKLLGLKSKITTAGDFQRGDKDRSALKRPRLGLEDGSGDDSAKKARDDYAQLVKSISEKIAADQAELDSVTKLTDAQKMQAKIFADIDGGFIKLTLEQKLYVDGMLQQLLAIEKLNVAKEADAKWQAESAKQTADALDKQREKVKTDLDSVAAMQRQVDEFGLTREQLQALSRARDLDSAASLRQRAAILDTEGPMGQLRDLYLQQADALERLAAKKDEYTTKEQRESRDGVAGASRAVREYVESVRNAGDATYRLVSDSMGGLEDGLSGMLVGKKFDVRTWVNQVIQEMFRLSVIRPFLASLGGGSGGGSGASWLGSIVSAAVGYFTGGGSGMATNTTGTSLPTSGGRANGGDVLAGREYIVGEDGPERLRMNGSSGTVIPNANSQGRQVTLIVNNHGEPMKAESTQRDTDQGTVIELMLTAVANDMNSGGRIHDATARRFGLNPGGTTPRFGS